MILASHLVSCDKCVRLTYYFNFQSAIFCSVTVECSHQFHPHSIICIIVWYYFQFSMHFVTFWLSLCTLFGSFVECSVYD